jgi:NAD(P)H dehydrogenase (quinone)
MASLKKRLSGTEVKILDPRHLFSDLPGNNWRGGARSDLNRLGTWVAAMGQSNADEEKPSVGDIDTAERFGHRIALICRRFRDGTPFETERVGEPEFRKRNIERRNAL